MINGHISWLTIGVILGDVVVVALLTWILVRYFFGRSQKDQQAKADNILLASKETAKNIELEAKDKALSILQAAENEVVRRRAELSNEEERLQRRRAELDHRMERLEQREVGLNKRQSAMDRRANEIEKMYSDQMIELQRIGQMTVDEARAELLTQGSPMSSLFGYSIPSSDEVASQMERSVTLSAIDLSKVPTLVGSLNQLCAVMQGANQRNVAQARSYAQSFTNIFGQQVPAHAASHDARANPSDSSRGRVKLGSLHLVSPISAKWHCGRPRKSGLR